LTDLRRYRAWVKDGEVWVDDQPLPKHEPPRHSDARTFVVIGAGAAGSAAVATLLDHGFGGHLIWLDQERQPAYDRTALSKFVIAGEMAPDEVSALIEPGQLRRGHLDRRFGKVRALDAKKRQITLADGQHIDYDAALLATGGKPVRPQLPGVDLPGIMTLRSREDAARLLDAAEPGQPVVIVGDSFIGLEAASALRKYGAQVHVVSRHEVPLAKDQSLAVDAGLHAAEGLWAAGDIATFPHAGRPVRIEHWRLAQQHGVIAAANMLGEQRRYNDVPFFWTYQHGRTYEVLGHARDWDRIEFVGEPEKGDFIALQCVGEQVEAVIAKGYSDAMATLSQRMKRSLSLEEALQLIG